MRRKPALIAAVLAVCWALAASPPTAAMALESFEKNLTEATLDNGLTVLVKENHTNPIVYVGSYSLAGARFEEKSGQANFVANMMPRGTGKRSGERISREIDSTPGRTRGRPVRCRPERPSPT